MMWTTRWHRFFCSKTIQGFPRKLVSRGGGQHWHFFLVLWQVSQYALIYINITKKITKKSNWNPIFTQPPLWTDISRLSMDQENLCPLYQPSLHTRLILQLCCLLQTQWLGKRLRHTPKVYLEICLEIDSCTCTASKLRTSRALILLCWPRERTETMQEDYKLTLLKKLAQTFLNNTPKICISVWLKATIHVVPY